MANWDEQIPGGLGTPADPNVGAMLAAANPQVAPVQTAPQQGNPYQQIQTELLARMMAAANQPTVMPSSPQQIQGPIAPAQLPMQGNGVGATLGNIAYSIGRGLEMTPQNEAAQRQVDAENARNQMDYQSQMMQAQRSGQSQQLEALGQASNLADKLGSSKADKYTLVQMDGPNGTYFGAVNLSDPTRPVVHLHDENNQPIAVSSKDPVNVELGYVKDYMQRNPNATYQDAVKSYVADTTKQQQGNSQFDQFQSAYIAAHKLDPNDPNAQLKAQQAYTKMTKTDPIQIRTDAFLKPVTDPNTGQTTWQRPSNAQGGLVPQFDPQQIASQQMAKNTGQITKPLTAFNTAIQHLDTLDKIADDLNNSDIRVANRAKQFWADQTGSPAPANFAAAKNAMSGEVAAALKQSGATNVEIDNVSATFDRAQSPAQLHGAINTYRTLLNSKAQQLQGQWNSGRQGQPNFQGNQQQQQNSNDPLGIR